MNSENKNNTKGSILYIGGFILPDKNAAAHRVLNNAKIFRSLGYDVTFIDTNRDLTWTESIFNTYRNVQGFNCYSQPYPKLFSELVKSNISIGSIIKIVENIGDVKAIICYNYQSIPLLKLIRYCKSNNIKIIADCTEGYSPRFPINVLSFIKNLDDYIRMKYVQKKADGLILISEKLMQYYNHKSKKLLLPPLIDLEEEKWIVNTRENLNGEALKFVYAGNIGTRKDRIDLIVKSIMKYKGSLKLELKVVGLTKQQFEEKYGIIEKFERADTRIFFLGRVSHVEALQHIKDSDFYIFYREPDFTANIGFPTKLVESIGCGTPVITNKCSDVGKYIIHGYNGFLHDFYNVEYELISLLNSDLKYLKSLKKNVDQNTFSYENYIEQTKFFLDSLLNDG